MWDVLRNLLQRKDVIGDIGGYLTIELKLFLELREVHETKVHLFNDFLLEYHQKKGMNNYNKLQKFVKDHSIFSKDTKDLSRSDSRLEKACSKALRRTTLSLKQRETLNNLVAFLHSSSFQEYKKVVLAQTLLFEKDFSLFVDHFQEFKALLEREGELLKLELATLTQIEDRLSTLFKQNDPYSRFSAATLVSFIRQLVLLYGLSNFKVESTGSTGRGTGSASSDYDIVLLVDPIDYNTITDGTAFPDFLNSNLAGFYRSFRTISAIRFEQAFHTVKVVGLKQIDGKVIFDDNEVGAIHLVIVNHEDDFKEIISFQMNHNNWFSQISQKRKTQFLHDVPLMKEYFRILNMNSLTGKYLVG